MAAARPWLATVLATAAAAASPVALGASADYQVFYEAALSNRSAEAVVQIRVSQAKGALRGMVLRTPPAGLEAIEADGKLKRTVDELRWEPPAQGGTLRYTLTIDQQRKSRNGPAYDALATPAWALFRADDVFPVRSIRRLRETTGESFLSLDLPEAWTAITPYLPDPAGRLPVRNPGKRMARPVGWVLAGSIGTRRERINGLEVTVSGPRGIRLERIAMLAMLRWNLPLLLAEIDRAPAYVSVVSAGPPMWRGALSAPNSIFVQAERPLISENATSTLIHEFVHVLLMDLATASEEDWIDEGLAEYLSLLALAHSGTISAERFDKALAYFRERGRRVKSMRSRMAYGPVTARAVIVLRDLDLELRDASGGEADLFTLVRQLLDDEGPVGVVVLRRHGRALLGREPRALAASRLPGLK